MFEDILELASLQSQSSLTSFGERDGWRMIVLCFGRI